ncbi:FixH family protein [Shewanella livingstonensis]|uniref:Cytochrome C oxidase Cbb3 n=1 Tax=Shewanella livingstonensis TaxID=150120 RepID=A0A3G8LVC2_9GAMM|nr:FixH family protein [Shewanella livingstonensis]AZG73334.1 cytochrome C oxidase Cbb3 [Shewanella livingstonensis]
MSDQLPWYKQFWPWFLIILPMCAVIASLTTLKIALDNSDSLVAEDYYKEGKAINMDLRKIKYAQQIGMKFLVTVADQELKITQQGGPEYRAALNVQFYHPTIEEKDFSLNATADANYVYHIPLDAAITGPWEVRIEGFDAKWRIQQRIDIKDDVEYWLN